MEAVQEFWCHSCKKQFSFNPLPNSEVECMFVYIFIGSYCKLTFCEKIEGNTNDPRNLYNQSTSTNRSRRLPSLQSLNFL